MTTASKVSAQGLERDAKFVGEQRGLFPCGEVAALGEAVVVDKAVPG